MKLTLLILLAAGTAGATSSDTKGAVRESAEVALVEVPVNVTGRDGKPIAGLTAADFEVYDDGKKQAITSVDVVDLNQKRSASALPGELPAAARRHFLFLFDLSFATPNEIVRSREAATHFVERGMAPEDLAAVATTSIEKGARILETFTADRRQLLEAIRRLDLPGTTNQGRDPLAFVYVNPGDPFAASSSFDESSRPGTGSAGPIDPTVARVYAVMAQKTSDNFSSNRVQTHLTEMDFLASALDAVEGRKTVIYFSEGFDGRLLSGTVAGERSHEATMADNDALFDGQYWMLDVDRRNPDSPLQRQLGQTVSLFRRSDCVVYPIDIAGLKANGDVTLGNGSRGEEALFAFANGTEGELIKNANDLEAQMRRIAERTSLTYILSFQPKSDSGKGKFHTLKVKTTAKGARVSARSGYYESKAYQVMSPLERALSAADVISHEKGKGDFPISVLAVPFFNSNLSQVPVLVEIPRSLAQGAASRDRLQLGVYVYAVDDSGKLADYFTRAIALDLSKDRRRFSENEILYYGLCRLLPGKYHVRVYIRDESDGRFGFQTVAVDVAEAVDAKMFALPPLFLTVDSSELRLKDESARKDGVSEPFRLGERDFVPDPTPIVASGGAASVCLMLYRKMADRSLPPFQIDGEVRDTEGRLQGPAHLTLVARSAPDGEGLVKLLVNFAPEHLKTGEYSLRVIFRDARDSRLQTESETRFRVS